MALKMSDMVTRIATEIRRPTLALPLDMTCVISKAILDAIAVYQKDRFRISDVDPSLLPSFNTVANQSIYTVSDNANISTIYRIDYLNALIGNTQQPLTRRTEEEINLLNQAGTQSGQPTDYAYSGNKIILYPIPSGIWNLTFGGHVQIAAPVTLSEDNNVWMNWAEQLIRCHAKYEIAVHVTRNPSMAAVMSPDPDGGPTGKPGEAWRAWARLKRESNKMKSVGYVRAMRF